MLQGLKPETIGLVYEGNQLENEQMNLWQCGILEDSKIVVFGEFTEAYIL